MNYNKITILQTTLIVAVMFATTSCMNNKSENTKDVAEEHNDAKFDNNKNENDAQFLVNAAEINMEEISLGQLAQQSGKSLNIKELGKMMETAHSKSLSDLTALAITKNITLPTSQTHSGQEAYNNLNNKSGKDFGKAYSNIMVSEHKEAIALFEKASTDCTDPDIKAWAKESLPALRTHLDHAMICQKETDNM